MVFGIFILLLILLIAFFHYIQGFFSATLSAIFAVIAATVAIAYHETIVNLMKPGKFADLATAVVLCCLFAVTYVILRVIFDRAVPGNIRIQSTIDKVGAAVMGLIAGIFTCGVLAIAAQTMSFGPSILGYSRYTLAADKKDVRLINDRQRPAVTRDITDALKSNTKFDDANDVNHLFLLPADDMVLGAVGMFSEGSLAGDRPLSYVHPDYLRESFADRLGIEPGAKHTATNFGSQNQVSVEKLYLRDSLRSVEDTELGEVRAAAEGKAIPPAPEGDKDEARLMKQERKPQSSNGIFLIVRVNIASDAADEKGKIRFSPGSVRLVVHNENGQTKDYFPIGTMDAWGGGTLWPNRLDDPMFLDNSSASGVDFVFDIEDKTAELFKPGTEPPARRGGPTTGRAAAAPAAGAAAAEIKPGTFIEFKRLARVDLGNRTVETTPYAPDPKYAPMRKVRLKTPAKEGQQG
jgi:hypothetical protein